MSTRDLGTGSLLSTFSVGRTGGGGGGGGGARTSVLRGGGGEREYDKAETCPQVPAGTTGTSAIIPPLTAAGFFSLSLSAFKSILYCFLFIYLFRIFFFSSCLSHCLPLSRFKTHTHHIHTTPDASQPVFFCLFVLVFFPQSASAKKNCAISNIRHYVKISSFFSTVRALAPGPPVGRNEPCSWLGTRLLRCTLAVTAYERLTKQNICEVERPRLSPCP